MKPLRCAVYTRKSTEEGLEQGFNSLDAQREACRAYILSQAGEGWAALPALYDDGGFSGGSMDRPAMQRLLADIGAGGVDVVVVYKVDRLTRSLADFARMVELFDAQGVSFVSVTQAFNTTTSMGRLTLNVLLSFAQFEREVTGERIRDKIAASKAKGMWMGGRPPLGYDGRDRKLVINVAEAELVRDLFRRYLAIGSVPRLVEDLRARGVCSKRWVNAKGEEAGGAAFSRGAVYHLLSNEVYRGAIRHKDRLYPNAHPPIVDEATWAEVQAMLARNAPDHPTTPRDAAPVLLRGLVYDDRDELMSAIHANRQGKRYRYYASNAPRNGRKAGTLPRIAMGVLDAFIIAQLQPRLRASWRPDAGTEERVSASLKRITLSEDRVRLSLEPEAMTDSRDQLDIPIRLKHRQGAVLIEAEGAPIAARRVDRALVRAVVLARDWADQLAKGDRTSVAELARGEGYCSHYAARLLPLAWLAPDLVEQILDGRQPAAMTLRALTKGDLPVDWETQRSLFATAR